jgi:8-oxo-dGTP pyrophosphatase MutT (NUDIX family)
MNPINLIEIYPPEEKTLTNMSYYNVYESSQTSAKISAVIMILIKPIYNTNHTPKKYNAVYSLKMFKDNHNEKIGVPGGHIKEEEWQPYQTIKREFREETDYDLPNLTNLRLFLIYDRILVYTAKTTDILPCGKPPNFHSTEEGCGEVIDRFLPSVHDMRLAAKKSSKRLFDLRNRTHESMLKILNHLNV